MIPNTWYWLKFELELLDPLMRCGIDKVDIVKKLKLKDCLRGYIVKNEKGVQLIYTGEREGVANLII